MSLTKRQITLLVLLVLVLSFLAWQVYKAFPLLMEPAKPSAETEQVSTMNKNAKANKEANEVSDTKAAQPSVSKQNKTPQQPQKIANIPQQSSDQWRTELNLSNNQKQQIQLLSQYRQLKLEKQIAQEKKDIVNARLQTAQAEKKLQKFSSTGEYEQPGNHDLSQNQATYQLVYTGKVNDRWSATLQKSNQLIDIKVGDKLQNGSKVTDIQNGKVLLQHDNMKTTITFHGQKQQSLSSSASKSKKDHGQAAREQADIIKPAQNNHKQTKQPEPEKQHQLKKSQADSDDDASKANNAHHSSVSYQQQMQAEKSYVASIHTQFDQYNAQVQDKSQTSKQDPLHSSEQKILAMDPQQYTIQLIASHHLDQLKHYLRQFQRPESYLLFSSRYQHKPWYAAISGHYQNIQEAVKAIKQLPSKLRQHQPFVKRIRYIQNKIQQNQTN